LIAGLCFTCNTGFQISTFGDACIQCTLDNCQSCEASGVCSVCMVGYSLVGGACVQCAVANCLQCSLPNVCDDCLGNFALTNSGTLCQVCLNPCETCGTNGLCLTCMVPYSQTPNSQGQCYACSSFKCIDCEFPDVNFCNACINGYVAVGGACVTSCPQEQCLKCSISNKNQCTSCVPGYFVDQKSAQCLQCSFAPRCTQCVPNQPNICL
jgi:hypothetical protein